MNYKARYCSYCKEHGTTKKLPNYRYPFYYENCYDTDEDVECDYCDNILVKMNLTNDEFDAIIDISTDPSFIQAMDELKQKDIVEFNLKMSQFKSQVSQTQQQQDNTPKCPTCGSTKLSKVSTASKASSAFMFGLLSQKVKKTWHCENCKYEW